MDKVFSFITKFACNIYLKRIKAAHSILIKLCSVFLKHGNSYIEITWELFKNKTAWRNLATLVMLYCFLCNPALGEGKLAGLFQQ